MDQVVSLDVGGDGGGENGRRRGRGSRRGKRRRRRRRQRPEACAFQVDDVAAASEAAAQAEARLEDINAVIGVGGESHGSVQQPQGTARAESGRDAAQFSSGALADTSGAYLRGLEGWDLEDHHPHTLSAGMYKKEDATKRRTPRGDDKLTGTTGFGGYEFDFARPPDMRATLMDGHAAGADGDVDAMLHAERQCTQGTSLPARLVRQPTVIGDGWGSGGESGVTSPMAAYDQQAEEAAAVSLARVPQHLRRGSFLTLAFFDLEWDTLRKQVRIPEKIKHAIVEPITDPKLRKRSVRYLFESSNSEELSLTMLGQVYILTHARSDGWVYGYPRLDPSTKGWLPLNCTVLTEDLRRYARPKYPEPMSLAWTEMHHQRFTAAEEAAMLELRIAFRIDLCERVVPDRGGIRRVAHKIDSTRKVKKRFRKVVRGGEEAGEAEAEDGGGSGSESGDGDGDGDGREGKEKRKGQGGAEGTGRANTAGEGAPMDPRLQQFRVSRANSRRDSVSMVQRVRRERHRMMRQSMQEVEEKGGGGAAPAVPEASPPEATEGEPEETEDDALSLIGEQVVHQVRLQAQRFFRVLITLKQRANASRFVPRLSRKSCLGAYVCAGAQVDNRRLIPLIVLNGCLGDVTLANDLQLLLEWPPGLDNKFFRNASKNGQREVFTLVIDFRVVPLSRPIRITREFLVKVQDSMSSFKPSKQRVTVPLCRTTYDKLLRTMPSINVDAYSVRLLKDPLGNGLFIPTLMY